MRYLHFPLSCVEEFLCEGGRGVELGVCDLFGTSVGGLGGFVT